jgi:S1-C subfamily serine protease
MKSGDRVLLIEGREVNNLADYRDITKDKKPGDRVAITVIRGSQQMVMDVELQSREEAERRAASSFDSGR